MRRALVAALLVVAVQPLAAQEIAIDIRVAGRVRPGADTLERAQALTARILGAAGLGSRWIDCLGDRSAGDVCQPAPAPDEFVVTILPVQPERGSCACGVAQRPLDGTPGSFITVYSDCVRSGAERLGVDEAAVLSVAIAHEIGHLLLSGGHAGRGIMRARPDPSDWRRAARGLLRFDVSQAALIRGAARARQQAAAAASPDG